MPTRVEKLLAQRAEEGFVGRKRELAFLLDVLEPDGPLVVQIYGLAGVGKSSLVGMFANRARSKRAAVHVLDCRSIEPTERSFLLAVAEAVGARRPTLRDVASRLEASRAPVVLVLDNFEVFGLLDTWLRQVFVPGLSQGVRVLLSGRRAPSTSWLTAAEWQGLFRGLALDALADEEALALLERAGVPRARAERIQAFAHGHPLALKLAAAASLERSDVPLEGVAAQRVVHELTRRYLSEVHDPSTRQALEAVSVMRRVTVPLLSSLGREDAQECFETLRGLPFVESGPDGLVLHDAVREAIAAELRADDPNRHREYRRAAWRRLKSDLAEAGAAELWRYTADMLYIIENPVVREAFFPTGTRPLSVEPAREADADAIDRMMGHEGAEARALLELWWRAAPECFRVVRDEEGESFGFYCMFDPRRVSPVALAADPIAASWDRHLGAGAAEDTALFLRRWLARDQGEVPSPVQAACWLDIKRAYLELRPRLRRVYLTVADLAKYASVAVELGFRPVPDLELVLDGRTYHTAMLDMGPASVDGWLVRLVAGELGIVEPAAAVEESLIDLDTWELVVGDERVALTRLEGGVLRYLEERRGKVVSREELLERVWKQRADVGSNVVDAVIRSLRKKLGPRASRIDTVRGMGYRLRAT